MGRIKGGTNTTRYDIACEWCGETFTASVSSARFCSGNHRKRANAEKNRPTCPDCGGPAGVRAKWDGCVRCDECNRNLLRSRRLARRHRIERLWNLGRSIPEIAEDLGSTSNSVTTEMAGMRDEGGWDLPHRYAMHARRRVAA